MTFLELLEPSAELTTDPIHEGQLAHAPELGEVGHVDVERDPDDARVLNTKTLVRFIVGIRRWCDPRLGIDFKTIAVIGAGKGQMAVSLEIFDAQKQQIPILKFAGCRIEYSVAGIRYIAAS